VDALTEQRREPQARLQPVRPPPNNIQTHEAPQAQPSSASAQSTQLPDRSVPAVRFAESTEAPTQQPPAYTTQAQDSERSNHSPVPRDQSAAQKGDLQPQSREDSPSEDVRPLNPGGQDDEQRNSRPVSR